MPVGFASLSLNEQVQLVQRAWQEPWPRLLVFDNCEAETLLAQWRPPHGGCRVLLTSRRLQWDATLGVQVLPLNVLARPESLTLLRQQRSDLAEDDADLNAIAANLGDLPLALHLAGRFLARYRYAVTPSAYLAQLQQPGLLEHPSLQSWQLTRDISATLHEPHVARTFALSYERLDARDTTDALALTLLARAAYFAPGEPIPRDVLLATLSQDADHPDATLAREDAIQRLYELGLLEPAASGAVRLHRLLAAFVQSAHSDPEAQTVVEQTMLTTARRLNAAGDPRPLLALEVHLRAVTDAAQRREDTQAAWLCNELGFHLDVVGQYAEARRYYERALAIREQVLGPEHPDTATSLNNLGALLQAQGSLGGARRYYERALAIREQVLGPEHPDTAQSLNNLGVLLQEQGDLGGARRYYERALAIWEWVLGPEHPDTAQSLNNLGALLQEQGDLDGARRYYERALAIREQVLGPEHPDTATSLNNLGFLHRVQGDLAGARSYYERALAICERVLGPEHPDTAGSLNNLGFLLQKQGDLGEARPYFERALHICMARLGLNHAFTQTVQDNLAELEALMNQSQ
jgi:Tfp pilus assembly protein PilF